MRLCLCASAGRVTTGRIQAAVLTLIFFFFLTCGFVLTPEVWFPLDSVQTLQGLLLLSSSLGGRREGPCEEL